MIQVDDVSFSYTVFHKNPGIKGTINDFFHRKLIKNTAIKSLNLTINDGEVIGLIGPNGAGKTTLTKLLTGIIMPEKGKLIVDGIDPSSRSKKLYKNIGVMFGQKTQLSWNLPPMDTFNMLSAIYELDQKEYKSRLDQLINMLDIGDIVKIPVRKLSLGQRIKCELLCALIHSPKYLFLDEPTIGLDIVTQKNIYDFLIAENHLNHTTIILTSHNLKDIEALSKRLLILARGQIIFDGMMDELPIDIKDKQEFNIKFIDTQWNRITNQTFSILELEHNIKKIGQENIISINREGISIEDLILSLYKEWDMTNDNK